MRRLCRSPGSGHLRVESPGMNVLLLPLSLVAAYSVVHLHRRFAWFEAVFDSLVVLFLLALVYLSLTYVPLPD